MAVGVKQFDLSLWLGRATILDEGCNASGPDPARVRQSAWGSKHDPPSFLRNLASSSNIRYTRFEHVSGFQNSTHLEGMQKFGEETERERRTCDVKWRCYIQANTCPSHLHPCSSCFARSYKLHPPCVISQCLNKGWRNANFLFARRKGNEPIEVSTGY